MALPLTLPADGYLRLAFTGQIGVSGMGVQQSWDLTALPEYVRADKNFKKSLLIFAVPLSAGMDNVSPTVSFFPAQGIPTELVLTVNAAAATDQLSLDVWVLHSILGALSTESKVYFILGPTGGGVVTSVFGRAGDVVAMLGDYTSSLIPNLSAVAGATVTDALNALAAAIAAIPPPPVTSVFGRVGAVAALLGDYTSSLITNLSGVAGATVTDALNSLGAALATLTTNSVINTSSVPGASATAALNSLNTRNHFAVQFGANFILGDTGTYALASGIATDPNNPNLEANSQVTAPFAGTITEIAYIKDAGSTDFDVLLNGIPVGSFNMPGTSGVIPVSFAVTPGDLVALSYSAGDPPGNTNFTVLFQE